MNPKTYRRYEENGKFFRDFQAEPLTFIREMQGAIKLPLESEIQNRQANEKTQKRDNRTFPVVWTTGARVYRHSFEGPFGMELSLNESDVRLGRLQNGAPVLDNHDMGNLCGVAQGVHGRSQGQIGVVENVSLSQDGGFADLRLSRRKGVDDIALDMNDGIIRNISVGFLIHKVEEIGEDEEGVPIFRAIDWEPMEISPVKVNADPMAQTTARGLIDQFCEKAVLPEEEKQKLRALLNDKKAQTVSDANLNETRSTENNNVDKPAEPANNETVETQNQVRNNQGTGDKNMSKTQETPEQPQINESEVRAKAAAEEKQRQKEIRSIVRKVGLDDSLADQYIDEDKSVDEVRSLVIDALAEKDKSAETDTRSANPATISVGTDHAREARLEGMTSALLHRYRPKTVETRNSAGQKIVLPGYELRDSGRQFAYLSLSEMARHCVEATGMRTGSLPKHKIVDIAINNVRTGLHSTSDFPEILANVANKTLRGGYQAAPRTWMPFVTETFVSDFKEISRTNLGDAPKLDKVPEGGEITRGSMSEAAEKYKVEEFAKIVGLTRKTIINDDLGAFTRLPERMGRRAADLESDEIWDLIKANAAMADGNLLFSTQHGNLAVDHVGAPSLDSLSELREKMRRQTGLDGAEISLVPVWIFVPPSLETGAEQFLAATRPNAPSEVNPFGPNGRTTLQMDVEPRLETGANGSLTHWFGTADKGQVDMVELARLEGTDGPQIQTRDGFDINGVELKIMHDIGTKAIDHRGMYKNAGA